MVVGKTYFQGKGASDPILETPIYENVVTGKYGYVEETGQDTGFYSGGYTGNIPTKQVAGVVHGQEYVLNAQTTKNLGLNDNNGGVMKEIRDLMYEQVKTSKRIHSIERQMLENSIEVA